MIPSRTSWAVAAAMVAALVVSPACARPAAPVAPKVLELGSHRVQVTMPAGWDALDQGTQKRFRKGESEIVLENLGVTTFDAALTSLHDDQRREVKSERVLKVDDHDAMEFETWFRLDHSWPLRLLFIHAGDDFIALHMPRLSNPETIAAFESIRDSLHFVDSGRR